MPTGDTPAEEAESQRDDPKPGQTEESSPDDPLDYIRQSLVEEEEEEKRGAKKPKRWWRKASKGAQKAKDVEAAAPARLEPEAAPDEGKVELQEEDGKAIAPEEFDSEIDELIEAIKSPAAESPEPEVPPETSRHEPETTVDIDELKKRAFQPRSGGARQEVTDEVRSIALQGGEEVLVEVQATRPNTAEERLTGIENALRPYRRIIYAGFAVLGAVMVTIAAILLYYIIQRFQPAKPVEESNLPFPTAISLPGGLAFNLERGELDDGQWNPQGPEWLEGTELCRWVAIPWSLQMEAVIRTLNPDDPIVLTMSNNDPLTYRVYSVRQVSVDGMQELDTGTPCLLLILAKADSDMRWVLTALP
jgi:hypothetical protein